MPYLTRDFKGYHQARETVDGKPIEPWSFYICGFGYDDVSCSVLLIDHTEKTVPINKANQILIDGKWYGPTHWNH